MATHDVQLLDGLVHKRFRSARRGEDEREATSLRLLATHAPGLAPELIEVTGTTVTMTRLPGTPLGDAPLTDSQLDAVHASLETLHTALPEHVLAQLPPARTPQAVRSIVRTRLVQLNDPAATAAERWLDSPAAQAVATPTQPVFGRADNNLENFLWDGTRTLLIDFEDAGRSDACLEYGALVEHAASRCTPDTTWDRFLASTGLSADRLHAARCLAAIDWLLILQRRPDRAAAQADRVLRLVTT